MPGGMFSGNPGMWGTTPVASEEEILRNAEIDETLRQYRIDDIKKSSKMLVLGSHNADEERHTLATYFANRLSVPSSDVQIDYTEMSGTVPGEEDIVRIISFPCSKKDRSSQLRLSAIEPTLVTYIIRIDESNESKKLLKSLSKSMSHLSFATSRVEKLDQTAVCIIISDCEGLRENLLHNKGDNEFREKLSEIFPDVPSHAEAFTDDNSLVERIAKQLEDLVLQRGAKTTHSIFLEKSVASESGVNMVNQILAILKDDKDSRVKAVLGADMKSTFSNVKPAQPRKEGMQKVITSAVQAKAKSIASSPYSGTTGLAILGVVVACSTLFLLRVLRTFDD